MSSNSHLPPVRRRRGSFTSPALLFVLAGWSGAQAAQPVIVTNPDPSSTAFSATFSANSTTGSVSGSFGTVPDGKRLVIENESIACDVISSSKIVFAYLKTNLGRTYLLLQDTGAVGNLEYYAGTFTSRMYADPTGLGTGDISFSVLASPSWGGSTPMHCEGAIVGHTVPAPRH